MYFSLIDCKGNAFFLIMQAKSEKSEHFHLKRLHMSKIITNFAP